MKLKAFLKLTILLGLLNLFPYYVPSVSAQGHLQTLIDETPEGGTVTLLDHTYEEEITISKPVTLIGSDHTVIRSCSNQPIIQVESDHVRLENIKIEHCEDPEPSISEPAIFVSGDNIHLEKLHVNSQSIGIQFDGVTNSVIEGGSITTNGTSNGIDVWESSQNRIQGVQIETVIDGIYLERSSDSEISENDIQFARYGIHLMYSDDVLIKENHSYQNFTGAMVMTSTNATITGNTFSENNLNVNSQGLFLFDAHQATVTENTLSENRIGINMISAEDNSLTQNGITSNFIGLQFNTTKDNLISDNSFNGNVNELQAVNSTENDVERNFWDSSIKLEKQSEGVSIFPYQAEPLYLLLTEDVPAYQLFFDSPSMTVIEALFKVPKETVMQDAYPLMQPPITHEEDGFQLLPTILKLVLGSCLTLIGIKLFTFRRKRI
ncbi:right-handed parallel beta-helix repeat-containing protein [Aquibacillus koreensis]|uniref:Right-handed parallel beta-helix repeat-containing protein n=1 Tax=Aquibacillus koreensis TaxID=279446 RepID=A0A9X3WGN5_9BACI|nr:NosD domain-containing protein [Aquibacillus koreensis]MCT2536495.1 right-handed parallel beta-helix repeat-containing protein [Aquibacillus koreensis]MDC3419417.1 right-handed parallel beta-helix repeat-containing protein [Aquibacillus koreensis]